MRVIRRKSAGSFRGEVNRIQVLKIIFHHIPKAAGSTFSASLYCRFNPGEVFRVSTKTKHERYALLASFPIRERENLRLVLSHMPFGAHRILGKGWHYYSMARDPEKRVISLVQYIRSNPTHYLHRLCSKCGPIRDLLIHPDAREMRNEMTRYYLLPDQMDSFETIQKAHLDYAISNINKYFPSVGLLEKYDESVVLFSELYKQPPLYYMRLNPSKGKPPLLCKEDREALIEANGIDVQLYAYLEEKFINQTNQRGGDFLQSVNSFKKRNSLYGKYLFLLNVLLFKLKKNCHVQ